MKYITLWFVVGSQFMSSFVYADAKCIMHEEEIPGTGNYALTFTDASCLDNYVQKKTAPIHILATDNAQKIAANKNTIDKNTNNITANKTTIATNAANITVNNNTISSNTTNIAADKKLTDENASSITTNNANVVANYLTKSDTYKILSSIPGMTEFVYTGSCGDSNHRISIAPLTTGGLNNYRSASSSYVSIDPNFPTFVYMNKKSADSTSTQGIAITTSSNTNSRLDNNWNQITIRRRGDSIWNINTDFGGPGNQVFPVGSFDLCNATTNGDGCHISGWPSTQVDGGITNRTDVIGGNSWLRATLMPADAEHPWGYFAVSCW